MVVLLEHRHADMQAVHFTIKNIHKITRYEYEVKSLLILNLKSIMEKRKNE